VKAWAIALALAAGLGVVLDGQAYIEGRLEVGLRSLFPAATSFSPKEQNPPHFKVYATKDGEQTLVGYAFITTDLVPRERGYDGPIEILVGMDLSGVLAGIVVGRHREPFGRRSIDRPAFPAQFRGKSIRDAFRVGADIDYVTRATISVTSASRAVRDSARLIAEKLPMQ
jgi:transcriptional regulator of nitric oxide reductase